jgi:hypothetical protein
VLLNSTIVQEAQVSSLLPLDAAAGTSGVASIERTTALPLELTAGAHALRALALGARLPTCLPTGSCWLVLTSPGVKPGVVPLVVAQAQAEAGAGGPIAAIKGRVAGA